HLNDIDAERLVSASIELDGDWRPASTRVLADAAARESYVPGRRPARHWHRRVMPLRPLLLRALGGTGPVDAAVQGLKDRREGAVSAGDDPDTVVACDAMLIELSRIYRTTRLTGAVHRLARSDEPELRGEAHAVLALVSGESPAGPAQGGGVHAW